MAHRMDATAIFEAQRCRGLVDKPAAEQCHGHSRQEACLGVWALIRSCLGGTEGPRYQWPPLLATSATDAAAFPRPHSVLCPHPVFGWASRLLSATDWSTSLHSVHKSRQQAEGTKLATQQGVHSNYRTDPFKWNWGGAVQQSIQAEKFNSVSTSTSRSLPDSGAEAASP